MLRTWRTRASQHILGGSCKLPSLMVAIMAVLIGLVSPVKSAQPVAVLTYNQYIGGDLGSLVGIPPDDLNDAFVGFLRQVAATRFLDRADRQAEQIAKAHPDLVALQEVWDLACFDLEAPAPGQGCADPSIAGAFVDHLPATLDALHAHGLPYALAAKVTMGFFAGGGGIPFRVNGHLARVVPRDGNAILANTATASAVAPVQFPSTLCQTADDGCIFTIAAPLTLPTPLGTVTVSGQRGFVAVDASIRGQRYRFVDTHLYLPPPGVPPEIQCSQAAELVSVLAVTTPASRSLVLAGDFNSDPRDQPSPGVLPTSLPLPPFCRGAAVLPPYQVVVNGGFTDIWLRRPGGLPGYTCCQAADLRNQQSSLSSRIDLLFSRDPPLLVRHASVSGVEVADRTSPPGLGLWPSDHSAVTATITLPDAPE